MTLRSWWRSTGLRLVAEGDEILRLRSAKFRMMCREKMGFRLRVR